MNRLTLSLGVIVATLVVGLAERPISAGPPAAAIPRAIAVVTLKDFNFFATGDNPVGVAVNHRGDIKIGILGLPIIVNPRPSTPIKTLTPRGHVSDFASLPLATDLQPCRDARPGRDEISPGVLQEPTPFMTGFAYHSSGDLYVGLPNCDPTTHGIWRVRWDGTAELFAQVPLSQLPKGLTFSKNNAFPLYVSDLHDFTRSRQECRDVAGTAEACTLRIWKIDQHGAVKIWKEDPLFYGDPDSPLLHPHGVNGIVVDKAGQNVYVSVTDWGRVLRIPINADSSAGEAEIIFEDNDFWGMDGITIGPDGNFYIVIVRTDQLVAIPPDGSSIHVVVQGHPLDGPTQLAFAKSIGDSLADKAGKPLPPLYITNGAGARTFFVGLALALGNGSLLDGVSQLVAADVISEFQAIELMPRPSVVRVLLSPTMDDDED